MTKTYEVRGVKVMLDSDLAEFVLRNDMNKPLRSIFRSFFYLPKCASCCLRNKDLLIEMEQIRKKVSGQDEKIDMIFNYLKQVIDQKEAPRKKIGFKN